MAYVLAIHQGLITQRKKPIARKRSNGKSWPAVSVFRYGLRALKNKAPTLAKIIVKIHSFLRCIMHKLGPPGLVLQKSVG